MMGRGLGCLVTLALMLSGVIGVVVVPKVIDGLKSVSTLNTAPVVPAHRRRAGTRGHAVKPATPAHRATPKPSRSHKAQHGGGISFWHLVLDALIVAGALAAAFWASLVWLLWRRVRIAKRRNYRWYPLVLSAQDQARPQDLEDMVEQLGNIVRALPERRLLDGQDSFAFDLVSGDWGEGTEWKMMLVCEAEHVAAFDAAIANAYQDCRVARSFGGAPEPLAKRLQEPEAVMRFIKDRSFIYSIVPPADDDASPPIEQIAQAQSGLGTASVVRLQFVPAASWMESVARRLYRRHENRLARSESWGFREAGLRSTLSKEEMRSATRTQDRALFWTELAVATEDPVYAKRLAAALQARRGEARLRKRYMLLPGATSRAKRRFALGHPPLLFGLRSLFSAREVAHLLCFPSARMKGVPLRRNRLPRLAAPPEVMRATKLSDPEDRFPPERRHLMSDDEKLEIFGSLPMKGPMPEVPVIKDPNEPDDMEDVA